MERVDICTTDDFATRHRLAEALGELGYLGNTDYADLDLGPGLSRYHRGDDEVTVFIDAWSVDVAGPSDRVRDLLARMAGRDYE